MPTQTHPSRDFRQEASSRGTPRTVELSAAAPGGPPLPLHPLASWSTRSTNATHGSPNDADIPRCPRSRAVMRSTEILRAPAAVERPCFVIANCSLGYIPQYSQTCEHGSRSQECRLLRSPWARNNGALYLRSPEATMLLIKRESSLRRSLPHWSESKQWCHGWRRRWRWHRTAGALKSLAKLDPSYHLLLAIQVISRSRFVASLGALLDSGFPRARHATCGK